MIDNTVEGWDVDTSVGIVKARAGHLGLVTLF
jgi:hypothetical protein